MSHQKNKINSISQLMSSGTKERAPIFGRAKTSVFAICCAVIFAGTLAVAQTNSKKTVKTSDQLEKLGTSETTFQRAKTLDPANRVRVVQSRSVDRFNRIELSLGGGLVGGGDSYVNSQTLGADLQYHLIPQISLGAKYNKYYNSLTNEGRRIFDDAKKRQDQNFEVPDIDYPIESYMGFVNIYPVYGKLNFFNSAITQFDIYLQLAYGQMRLSSGDTSTYGAGVGAGVWWTQNLTTRLEAHWQAYQDKVYSGARDLNVMTGTLRLGLML